MSRSLIAIAALVFFTGVQTTLAQSTIFVSSTTGSDAFDGATATIVGGSGPKQTLAAAYAAASAGDTISIEAGTYTENFDFTTAAKGVIVEIRSAGAVTVATFTGTSTIAVTTGTVNLTGGVGSVAVSGGAFTLTSGTLSLGAGKLAFTTPTALTVTGGTATGSSPSYTGAVTASYTKTAAGSAGTELPANLNAGGTLTVNGAFSTTFPSAITAPGGITIAATATGTTTFNGAVAVTGASGITFAGGFEDVVFNSTVSMGNGILATTAGGATPSVTINGAFTAVQDFISQGGAFNNGAGVTVTVASLSVNAAIIGGGNTASNTLGYALTNNGTMTVTSAISEGSASDADETDTNAIALTNAGTLTVGANSSIAGVFDNTGGTLALGSTTFTLSGPGAHVAMGTVTGAASTVVVSGAAGVPASAGAAAPAFDIAGNLTITGNGGTLGALSVAGNMSNSGTGDITAATRVGGNLTLSGATADISGGGSVLVSGGATFAGTTSVLAGAGTNRVTGAVTVSGTLTLAQAAVGGAGLAVSGAVPFTIRVGSITVSGSGTLTVPGGSTLLSDGSVNTSNGGAFAADPAGDSAADNARIAFLLPNNGSATYTPGPNTSVDDLFVHLAAGGTAGTLSLAQSVSVDENFTTDAGTNVSLGNFLIRINGNTAAATVNGAISTPAGQDGALSFEGTTTTLAGLGNISNILVNVGAGNRATVLAGTSVDFTGRLTLFTGGLTVAAGADISPTGSTAEVRRNAAGAAATTDIIGAGTFNGDTRTYILSIFGAGPVTAASEFAATGITTLNIEDTAVYTTDKAATVGNVNVATGASLLLGETFDLTSTGAVANSGIVEGTAGGVPELLILAGANQTHTNTGNMGPTPATAFTLSAQASGIVFNGTATLAAAAQAATINNLVVGNGAGTAESITMNNVQQVNGTITVASDGSLTIGLVQDDGVAGTGNGDEGSVDGTITVANGGSLTWTSNAIVDAAVAVGGPLGAAPTFNFNGNIVGTGTAAASFSAVSNAVLGSSGSFDANHAVAISTNSDGAAAPTSALPGLIVDAAATIPAAPQSLAVAGTTDVNATWGTGGSVLGLSGNVFLGAGLTTNANVTITGTSVTVEGGHTIAGTLTHNATNVDYTGDAVAGNNPDNLTVTALFTQTAGDVSLSGVDLLFNGGITYTAGAFTANAAPGIGRLTASTSVTTAMTGDFVVFGGGALTVGLTPFSVPNLAVAAPMTIAGGDHVIVRDFFYNLAGVTVTSVAPPATAGILTLGDGAGQFIAYSEGATVTRVGAGTTLGVVAFGSEVATDGHFIYDVFPSIPVTLEMPAAFDALTIKAAATGTQLAAGANITVDNLTLDGSVDVEGATVAAGESLTVTTGGAVTIGVNGAITNESYAPQTTNDFTLTYDNLATTTSTPTWNAAHEPDLVISPVSAGAGVVALHANRTATDLTVNNTGGADVFDTAGNTITIRGALNLNGNPLAIQNGGAAPAAGGSIAFAGTGAQSITGGLFFNGNVTINNAAGVTLSGGNLNVSNNAAGAVCNALAPGNNGNIGNNLTLTNGTLTTGTNRVILCHQNTTNQGFTRTSGSIFGNVQATVDGTASPNTTDRVEFPLGDMAMNYRPFAITFNTPNTLAADPVLLASYNESNAGGINGLPISAVDELNNPFEIGRYATDFHWELTSTPTVTPSINYDVEYRAAGFANFVDEDIEKSRAIRRQDGNTNNFWIKVANGPANNDNFAVSATEPVLVARNAVGAINADGVLFAIGLENNLAGTDPAAITLNAGNNEVIDLTTVFDGGSPNNAAPSYTYAVTNGDAAVATGATAGDDLTVTGVAAGTTTVTVQATDSFGAVATATVSVTVNAAFAAGEALEDVTVNAGTADQTVDGAVASTGGTAPITFAVATSDAAVATAVVDGAGEITLTFVGTGTATITLTATDAEGDTVVSTFDVTVNAALAAAGGLADLTVTEGDDAAVDASGEFSGGTIAADYDFSVESADPSVATASNVDAAVTVTGVAPYVITNGVVTADTAPVTITVTATDDLGATGTSTFTADVNPVAGNVDGSGGPTEVGASLTLDAFVGLQTLTAKQTIAADFNGSGTVNAFDAALIFDAFVNGKTELVEFPSSTIAYGELTHEGNLVSIPVQITGDKGQTRALSFASTIDPAYAKVVGIESTLGDGWIVRTATKEDGSVALAAAGYGSLNADGTVAILTLELVGDAASFNLRAEGAVNDNPVANIDELEVVELPETFALNGNYPNPFNASTTISFDLPQAAEVEIEVYDLIGRRVMAIPSQTMQAGAKRSVQVDGNRLASGSYFYRVIAKMDNKTIVETDRMMLVK